MRTALMITLSMMLFWACFCFADEIRINDITSHAQSHPIISSAGEAVYLVYQDTSGIDYDVRMMASEDGGNTFTASSLVHPESTEDQFQPDLVTGIEGEVYIVWADYSSGTDFDIYITRTSDGSGFTKPVRANLETKGSQLEPSIAVNTSGVLFAAWNDNRESTNRDYGVRWDVRIARSLDGGVSFQSSVKLSEAETEGEEYFALYPELATSGDAVVHAVWWKSDWEQQNMRLRYSRSEDGGGTFSSPITLVSGKYILRQQLEADGSGRVALVWEDDRNRKQSGDPNLLFGSGRKLDIYAMYSENDGVTWSEDFIVNREILLNQQRPALALLPGAWAVSWSDNRNVGEYTIRYASEQWPPSMSPLSSNKVDDISGNIERTFPSMTAVGDDVILVWQDFRNGDYDLYLDRP